MPDFHETVYRSSEDKTGSGHENRQVQAVALGLSGQVWGVVGRQLFAALATGSNRLTGHWV